MAVFIRLQYIHFSETFSEMFLLLLSWGHVPCRLRVVRIDLLHFLAGCHTRRLNQAISVLWLASFRWYVFCLLVVLVKFHYLPSDWVERLLWGSLTMARDCLQKAQAKECIWFSWFILLCCCSIEWMCRCHLTWVSTRLMWMQLVLCDV